MPIPVPPAEWHAQLYGAFGRSSNEAFDNAICTYNLLHSLGWTVQAVSAVYGNIEAESGYNPWRWQSDNVLATTDRAIIETSQLHGYGFVQFTPAGKYIYDPAAQANTGYGPNFSDSVGNIFDGDSQLRYIDEYADYDINYGYNYHITYQQFKTDTTLSPEYLAKAWLHNYERPGDQSTAVEDYRASIARYWYDILIQYDPSDPIPPESNVYSSVSNKFKLLFYLKPWYRKI